MAQQQYRSETGAQVPQCFKFEPTDQMLIVEFLLPYARREIVCRDDIHLKKVYGKNPRDLLCVDGDVGYYFTTRTKCGGRIKCWGKNPQRISDRDKI